MPKRALFAAAILIVVLGSSAPAAAAAADTTAPRLRSIELSRSAVTVSGLQTVLVGVRVRLTDDTGVQVIADPVEGNYWPTVSFGGPGAVVLLTRTEGTPQDGIWTGQLPITSAWTGLAKTTKIQAYDVGMKNLLDVDPNTVIDAPSVTVQSSHRPGVDLTFSPEPLPAGRPVTEQIRVWDIDTGLAWPNAPLVVGYEVGCFEAFAGRLSVHTNAAGIFRRTVPGTQTQFQHCAWVPGLAEVNAPPGFLNPTMIAYDAQSVRARRFTVGAAPAKAAVAAGTNVDVNGVVTPVKPSKTLQLQRLSGATWKTVNTGTVRSSGRYTIVATPPGRATYAYRVYAPGDADTVGATSKAFTIRGT